MKRIYTIEQVEKFLADAIAAKARIIEAQSYGVGRRNLTRVKLDEINREIAKWENEKWAILNPGGRFRIVVVQDG